MKWKFMVEISLPRIFFFRLAGQKPAATSMPEEKVPVNMQDYRIQKADLNRFSDLT
jgi:hypothetical protein